MTTRMDVAVQDLRRFAGGLSAIRIVRMRAAKEVKKVARLHRVDCAGPGIIRRRAGRGFAYFGADGRRIQDPAALQRIKDLVIPPAWRDVWICASAHGHIQAVGTDAAGRRQYIYHSRWRERRDLQKFEHMISFARALPALRRRVSEDLSKPELDHQRVLACAVRLLDRGFFRIGSEGYAEQNGTYGLATIRRSHVRLGDNYQISFDYIAKAGKRRIQSVVDPDAWEVVRALKARRGGGPELLAYREGPRWMDVKSSDINEYIKGATGDSFTAKDFRTWSATVLAAVGLAVSTEAPVSATGRKRVVARAIQEVSHYLGNTPAVCRSSYIDPRIFDRFDAGLTIAGALQNLGEVAATGEPAFQGAVEEAVLDLLEGSRKSREALAAAG